MADDWITTREAVELSGYHPYHLRFIIREGKINSRKFGTIWQVSRESLLNYLKEAQDSSDNRRGPKR
jgi:hypothetical protein